MTVARAEEQPENAAEARASLARTSVLLVPVLAGLAASAVLVVDYLRPAPVFCNPESGCAALKLSKFAAFLGVPTPIYGVAGFLLLGIFALWRGNLARTLLLVAATVSALVGLALFNVQLMNATWCPFCLVADTSGCLALGIAIWRKVHGWDPPEARAPRGAMTAAIALALVVPIAVGTLKKPIKAPLPEAIAREIALTPHGKVTVVDFADFECPFCRETHAILAPLVAEHRDRVRVVRKNVPLLQHPHAQDAARAACCGEELGKGDAMADALFSAPVNELTPEGCAKLAVSLGLDEAAFRKCTSDPATDSRIQDDKATFKAAQGRALPTLWIDDDKVEGFRPDDTLEKALNEAIARRS